MLLVLFTQSFNDLLLYYSTIIFIICQYDNFYLFKTAPVRQHRSGKELYRETRYNTNENTWIISFSRYKIKLLGIFMPCCQ